MDGDFTATFFQWLDQQPLRNKEIAEQLNISPRSLSTYRSSGLPKKKIILARKLMAQGESGHTTRDFMQHGKIGQVFHQGLPPSVSEDLHYQWNDGGNSSGGPPKPPLEENKISLSFTNEEFELIESAAIKTNMSVKTFIKSWILDLAQQLNEEGDSAPDRL